MFARIKFKRKRVLIYGYTDKRICPSTLTISTSTLNTVY